jgi:hypothetical protein
MPNIADHRIAAHAIAGTGSPAAGATERALSLLTLLSDAELARYGEIAHDQATAEWSRWRIEGAVLLATAAALGGTVLYWGLDGLADLAAETSGARAMLGMVLGAMIYLPYRRAKNLKLWNRHCEAVRDEQRRRVSAEATGVRVDVAR